jgi:hypothetical protein
VGDRSNCDVQPVVIGRMTINECPVQTRTFLEKGIDACEMVDFRLSLFTQLHGLAFHNCSSLSVYSIHAVRLRIRMSELSCVSLDLAKRRTMDRPPRILSDSEPGLPKGLKAHSTTGSLHTLFQLSEESTRYRRCTSDKPARRPTLSTVASHDVHDPAETAAPIC